MERLPEFALVHPGSVTEAIARHGGNAEARYLGGGTDLVANIRRGIDAPKTLVDITGIASLSGLSFDEGGVTIGGGVSVERIAGDERIKARYPAIAEAAMSIAAPAHRAAATLGGNLCLDTRCVYYNQSEWWRQANGYCLKRKGEVCHVAPTGNRCHAAFSGDLAPALIALEAKAVLRGPGGRRKLPLADIYREDGRAHLALEPGEMLTRVDVPAPAKSSRSGYEKGRLRDSIDFPLAGVAASLALNDGKIGSLLVALTGTNPRPLLVGGLEGLAGRKLDDAAFAEIDKAIRKQVQPMRTTMAAGNYRRHLAGALAEKLLRRLAG